MARTELGGECNQVSPSSLQTPSSDFWKELCLALPRKVSYQGIMADPQIQLEEDKDPMLILHSSYLEYRGDPHPEGDLGTVTICLCSYMAPIAIVSEPHSIKGVSQHAGWAAATYSMNT